MDSNHSLVFHISSTHMWTILQCVGNVYVAYVRNAFKAYMRIANITLKAALETRT